MMNRAEPEPGMDVRLRTMRILWAVFIVNVGLLALVCYFSAPTADSGRVGLPGATGTSAAPAQFPTLLMLFFVLAGVVVALSFVLKRRFMSKAVGEQRADHVQTAMIVALVFCETSALFGMMSLFLLGNRYSYLLFVVAAAGMLLHMPRREDLLAASYKSGAAGVPREF